MNSDKVLYSLVLAAKGARILHACKDASAANVAFRQCLLLFRDGVLHPRLEFNLSNNSVRFEQGGTVQFVDANNGALRGFRVENIVYDEAQP